MQGTKYENQVRQLEIYAALSWGNFVANLHTFSSAYFWRSKIWWRTSSDNIRYDDDITITWSRSTKDDDITIPGLKATIPKKEDGVLPGDGKYGNWLRLHLLTNQKTNIELEKMAPKRHFCDIVPG